MSRLYNEQYHDFILSHVIRPYQGMLGLDERVTAIVFKKSESPVLFNYCDLIMFAHTNKEWWSSVISRLSGCYSAIDYSFFPNEAFAQDLQKALITSGVKPIVRFSNDLYVNDKY